MKVTHLISVLFSIFLCTTWVVVSRVADNEKVGVPDYYRSLDTSLPFNDMARKSLDLKISNAEYDAIRWQYFEDRVAPNYNLLQAAAAWEDFKQRTERPDYPGRLKTLRDYLETYRWVSIAAALYLFLSICFWAWLKVLRPAKKVVLENGVLGFLRLILFGKEALLPK